MQTSRRRRQQGAAAVELALILPTLLILLGCMVTLGRAYWTQYLMLDIVASAAHSCTLQQQAVSPTAVTNNGPTVATCATNVATSVASRFGYLCPGSNVTFDPPLTVVVPGGTVAGSANRVLFMDVTARCNMPYWFASTGGTGATFPVVARSSFPYIN